MPLRPRQPTTTVSTWSLSLFAVYSAVPLLLPHEVGKRLNDQEEVAAQLLYVRSPAEELTVERRGRLMGTVMGVAGFTQCVFLIRLETRADGVGVELVHRTFGVKGAAGEMAVHSSRRRMVWIEPEPGFFIHAVRFFRSPPWFPALSSPFRTRRPSLSPAQLGTPAAPRPLPSQAPTQPVNRPQEDSITTFSSLRSNRGTAITGYGAGVSRQG